MTETRTRLDEKHAELETYNVTREEYDTTVEDINKIIQTIENKSKQTQGNDLRQTLNLLKVNFKDENPLYSPCLLQDLTNEIQIHRSLIDRLQLLSSNLSSQLTDSNERERVRRRLNEITHRWTELEQDILNEEEMTEEVKNLSELFHNNNTTCERWIKQAQDLIQQLIQARNIEILDQLIPKGKNALFEYQTSFEQIQRLRNRLNRVVQTNKTPEAIQKVWITCHLSATNVLTTFYCS